MRVYDAMYIPAVFFDFLAAFVTGPLVGLLNSNFSTSFFGAVAGSGVIILIDWYRRKLLFLADINTSIGELSGLSSTLLCIKKQHTLPMVKKYKENVLKYKQASQPVHVSNSEKTIRLHFELHLQKHWTPSLFFDLPTDRIYSMAPGAARIIPIISQTKRTLVEIENIYKIWNQQIDYLNSIKDHKEIISYYLGISNSSGHFDTNFRDTINALEQVVDDGIFFCELSIKKITEIGRKSLPCWLKKKIAKIEFVDPEYLKLVPSSNYKQGWDN